MRETVRVEAKKVAFLVEACHRPEDGDRPEVRSSEASSCDGLDPDDMVDIEREEKMIAERRWISLPEREKRIEEALRRMAVLYNHVKIVHYSDEEMEEEMENVKLLCFKEAMRNVLAGMALEGLLLASAP